MDPVKKRRLCFGPRITAAVSVKGHEALCTINGVYKIDKPNLIGEIGRIGKLFQPWMGHIAPVMELDENRFKSGEEIKNAELNITNYNEEVIFNLVSKPYLKL